MFEEREILLSSCHQFDAQNLNNLIGNEVCRSRLKGKGAAMCFRYR